MTVTSLHTFLSLLKNEWYTLYENLIYRNLTAHGAGIVAAVIARIPKNNSQYINIEVRFMKQ